MAFTFVHAADLHLGSPLRGLAAKDPRLAEAVREASWAAFAGLIDATIERRAGLLIIAGDVFDGDWRDYASGLRFLRELTRATRAGVSVHMLRGNHDAMGHVTRRLEWPPGVKEFSTRRAETHVHETLPVALHGHGFPDREVPENLVPDYPDALPGRFNIGVLHTSLDGREGHATYAPCTPRDLAAKRYDYWALGHVHAYERVMAEPLAIYPGVLQARNIRERGAKGAVVVTVDDGLRVAAVDRLLVDRVRFEQVEIAQVSGGEHAFLAALDAALEGATRAAEGRLLGLRVRVSAADPDLDALLADRDRLSAEIMARAERTHHDVILEKLVVTPRPRATPAPALGDEAIADPAALLDEVLADPEAARRLLDQLKPLIDKLPPEAKAEAGLPEGEADLLREARDLILMRLGSAP
jgi:DNA repair exonuclease SbcCD nuclease subunit